jgi:hypothetical protein
MEIRDVIGIFHFHYWRISSEAVNKNNHLLQWFYLSEEVDIAFQHLWCIFPTKCWKIPLDRMDYLHHNEQIFNIIGPALTSSAKRVEGLFEKEINRWLSNIVLFYSVDKNISLFSLTYFFTKNIHILAMHIAS